MPHHNDTRTEHTSLRDSHIRRSHVEEGLVGIAVESRAYEQLRASQLAHYLGGLRR